MLMSNFVVNLSKILTVKNYKFLGYSFKQSIYQTEYHESRASSLHSTILNRSWKSLCNIANFFILTLGRTPNLVYALSGLIRSWSYFGHDFKTKMNLVVPKTLFLAKKIESQQIFCRLKVTEGKSLNILESSMKYKVLC